MCVCVCKVYTILPKFITLGVMTMHGFSENEQVCVLIQITTLLQLSPTCPYVTLPPPLLLIFLYTAPPYNPHTHLCSGCPCLPSLRVPGFIFIFIFSWAICFPQNMCFYHISYSVFHISYQPHLNLLSQNSRCQPWGNAKEYSNWQ